MIQWIKFKGSTEEERKKEINKLPAVCLYPDKSFSFFHTTEELNGRYIPFLAMTYWCHMIFPGEDKLERKIDFVNNEKISDPSYCDGLYQFLNQEFDNIYQALNQLKDEIRKR